MIPVGLEVVDFLRLRGMGILNEHSMKGPGVLEVVWMVAVVVVVAEQLR